MIRAILALTLIHEYVFANDLGQFDREGSSHAMQTIHLTPQFYPQLGSERAKVEYGAYEIPSRSVDNGMRHIRSRIDPPCTTCLVTWMRAQLEYENGITADAKTGAWMHHVVFRNVGKNDSVCSEMQGQRFFASGNERTPVDLTKSGTAKTGYHIASGDRISFAGELMNLRDTSQRVIFSMVWEYIPSIPSGFEEAIPYWLDIGGCSDSNKPAKQGIEFSYISPTLNLNFNGRVAFVGGHLHDGGTRLEIFRNDRIVCVATADYSSVEVSALKLEHISSISGCQDVSMVEPGDKWHLMAHYDTIQHAPMFSNDGTLEPVMGIALAYVVKDPLPSYPGGRLWLAALIVLVLFSGTSAAYIILRGHRTSWKLWKPQCKGIRQAVQSSDPNEEEAAGESSPLFTLTRRSFGQDGFVSQNGSS